MQRYFIQLSYNGKYFHGWQVQENAITVQGILEKALNTLLGNTIKTTGAGRTDSGVHARNFIAHFDHSETHLHQDEKLIYKLNKLVGKDIVVEKMVKVKNDAHARFDAISRTYKYYISTQKDPFNRDFCYEFEGKLDVDRMDQGAKLLMGYNDFKSFCKLHSDVKTTLCKLYCSEWSQEGKFLVYTVTADRFLRNMVRAMVGTMFELGRNKIDIDLFKQIIEAGDRNIAGASILAKGLFLMGIEYPENIFLNH